MYQVSNQTDKELYDMYNELPKEAIIGMLIECHKTIQMLAPEPVGNQIHSTPWNFPFPLSPFNPTFQTS